MQDVQGIGLDELLMDDVLADVATPRTWGITYQIANDKGSESCTISAARVVRCAPDKNNTSHTPASLEPQGQALIGATAWRTAQRRPNTSLKSKVQALFGSIVRCLHGKKGCAKTRDVSKER